MEASLQCSSLRGHSPACPSTSLHPARLGCQHLTQRHCLRSREHTRQRVRATASTDSDSTVEAGGYTWPKSKQVRTSAEAIQIMGLGTWRLRGRMDGPFEALAAQLESAWRHHFTMELRLHALPEDLRFADSLDPERRIGGFSYVDLADPPEGERSAGWPRLLIENRAYATRAFRKLHLELAARQDGLQVLHCVLYPRLEYDLPILSVDMVGSAVTGRVSLAIADPCPAAMDRSLPPAYEQFVRQLQQKYGMESNRGIPDWGRAIFSDLCVIMRPESADDLRRFLLYTISLHQVHLLLSKNAQPVTAGREAGQRLADIWAAHQRYCEKQLENSKTSSVLQAAFSEDFAQRYMSEVMFDAPAPAAAGAAAAPSRQRG